MSAIFIKFIFGEVWLFKTSMNYRKTRCVWIYVWVCVCVCMSNLKMMTLICQHVHNLLKWSHKQIYCLVGIFFFSFFLEYFSLWLSLIPHRIYLILLSGNIVFFWIELSKGEHREIKWEYLHELKSYISRYTTDYSVIRDQDEY